MTEQSRSTPAMLARLQTVEVLDSFMGTQKTTRTLAYINGRTASHPEERWIFCTPFIEERDGRTVLGGAGYEWHSATNEESTAVASFLRLLQDPNVMRIAITHQLLIEGMRHAEVRKLIEMKRFGLFLDETIDLVRPFNKLSPADLDLCLKKGILVRDEANRGRVLVGDEQVLAYESNRFFLDKLCKEKAPVYMGTHMGSVGIVTMEEPTIFTCFNRMILATYQFEGTTLANYLEVHGIRWEPCMSVECLPAITKAELRSLITIVDKYDEDFRGWDLGGGWYRKAPDARLKDIAVAIRNIGDNYADGFHRVGYTLPKPALGTKRGKGVQPTNYSHGVKLDKTIRMGQWEWNELDMPKEPGKGCFIPCNMRASNGLSHKDVLIHAFNRRPPSPIAVFFRSQGIKFDANRFALNELLQWVWRSAIRDGKPIHLAIFSAYMRNLFVAWLYDDVGGKVPVQKKSKVVRMRKKRVASNEEVYGAREAA